MKIVHVQQSYEDGMGYQENILPAYQAKLGHEVTLITSDLSPYYGFQSSNRYKSPGEYIENGFKIRRIKTKGEFKGRFVLFDDLFRVLEEEKPDYIFHHGVTAPSLYDVVNYKKKI